DHGAVELCGPAVTQLIDGWADCMRWDERENQQRNRQDYQGSLEKPRESVGPHQAKEQGCDAVRREVEIKPRRLKGKKSVPLCPRVAHDGRAAPFKDEQVAGQAGDDY